MEKCPAVLRGWRELLEPLTCLVGLLASSFFDAMLGGGGCDGRAFATAIGLGDG